MERASWIGSGRNNTEFTTAKVAVLAAIQTAMVRTTVTVNPLSPIRDRTACRRSRKADSISANTQIDRLGVATYLMLRARRLICWENLPVPRRFSLRGIFTIHIGRMKCKGRSADVPISYEELRGRITSRFKQCACWHERSPSYSDGMQSTITRRIERELGITGLLDALANKLPASDLRSLMLEVYRIRASQVKEPSTLARAARDPLMAPSAVSARDLTAFDSVAFAAAEDFAALDLAPVCPFGASSALGRTSQNNVLTAIRNAEALGDSTIAMALEAARRRGAAELVRLCASHRVIRLQPFEVAGFTPHFRLFGLVTAGRDTGSSRFETAHLLEH